MLVSLYGSLALEFKLPATLVPRFWQTMSPCLTTQSTFPMTASGVDTRFRPKPYIFQVFERPAHNPSLPSVAFALFIRKC